MNVYLMVDMRHKLENRKKDSERNEQHPNKIQLDYPLPKN